MHSEVPSKQSGFTPECQYLFPIVKIVIKAVESVRGLTSLEMRQWYHYKTELPLD